MQSVKILFLVTIILIVLAAVASVALSGDDDGSEAVRAGDLQTTSLSIE
jgi:hypothetical protein